MALIQGRDGTLTRTGGLSKFEVSWGGANSSWGAKPRKYGINITLNSTLQCNLIEGPFIYKVTGAPWDFWGHHKNTCPLERGLEINILKANGRAKVKEMCLKEQQIYQSNCLEFTWDFILNKYQCL